MGIYQVKPRFQRSLRGAEVFLVDHRVHPDYVTFAALGLSVCGGVALYTSRWALWLLLIIPLVAIGRTALNALDGLVARGTGLARPWGEVLNELCDRLSDVALFVGVALAPGSSLFLGAAALVLMLLSSYVGITSQAAGGPRQYGGVMCKADRMILLSIAAVAAAFLPGVHVFSYFLAVLLGGLCLTLFMRLRTTYADLQSGR